MRPLRLAASLALLVLVTSACNIIFVPNERFEDAIDIGSTADPNQAADQTSLGGHDSIDYRVDLSGTRSSDVFYVELDQRLALSVYRSNGSVFASSSSEEGFTSGLGGLGLGAQQASQQAIGVNLACRGSCVIARPTTDTIFVRVANHGAGSRNFRLYVYGEQFADTNEPSNDTPAGATFVSTSDSGAIEVIGDVDYFEMNANGRVRFTTGGGGLNIVANIPAANGLSLTNGQEYDAVPGDIVRVEVPGGSQAGAAAVSHYTLAYVP